MMSASSSFILSILTSSALFHKNASFSSEASIERARAKSLPYGTDPNLYLLRIERFVP